MPPPVAKSCYVVETSVGPGGSRWAELHAYTDPAHVRRIIDWFCQNPGGNSAYHGIFYGAVLGVWTIQRGEVVSFLDIHPFIEVKLRDNPPVTLDNQTGCLNLVKARRKEIYLAKGEDADESSDDDDDEDDDEEYDDDYDDADLGIYEEIEMRADWAGIWAKLPPLEPPLLESGERATQKRSREVDAPEGTYFYLDGDIRFGSYEVENGETLEGLIPFKPLPSDLEDEDEADEDSDQ